MPPTLISVHYSRPFHGLQWSLTKRRPVWIIGGWICSYTGCAALYLICCVTTHSLVTPHLQRPNRIRPQNATDQCANFDLVIFHFYLKVLICCVTTHSLVTPHLPHKCNAGAADLNKSSECLLPVWFNFNFLAILMLSAIHTAFRAGSQQKSSRELFWNLQYPHDLSSRAF